MGKKHVISVLPRALQGFPGLVLVAKSAESLSNPLFKWIPGVGEIFEAHPEGLEALLEGLEAHLEGLEGLEAHFSRKKGKIIK